MRFLPILNFNQPNLSSEPQIYLTALSVLAEFFDEVEISLVSMEFWDKSPEILKHANRLGLKLSFGTVLDIQQAYQLENLLAEFKPSAPIKFFAPSYNSELDKFCDKKNLLYAPGIQDPRVFDLSQKLVIKVFPCLSNSSGDFLRILQGPYPELKNHLTRIFLIEDSQQASFRKKVLIKTPQDYQNIRQEFLNSPDLTLIIEDQKIDTEKLARDLKSSGREGLELYATGFSNFNQEIYRKLKNMGFDYYATRVFNHLDPDQDLKTQMLRELESHLSLV
jgi:2-keto-3-deoxy-6-phosphogluconate aldolase